MKRFLISVVFILGCLFASAQSINFDNYVSGTDNDFVNNFDGNVTLYQQQTGGITGGAIKTTKLDYTPANLRNISYDMTQPTTASLCFKYDTALFDGDHGYPAAEIIFYESSYYSIYLKAFADGNGIALKATRHYGKGGRLTAGHWYKLEMSFYTTFSQPDKFVVTVSLYDLDSNGTSSPVLRHQIKNHIVDNYFYPNNLSKVAISSCEFGGATLLDNFNVQGKITGINSVLQSAEFNVPTLMGNELNISISDNNKVSYRLYSVNGSLLEQGVFIKELKLKTDHLPASQYIIVLTSDKGSYRGKITKL